MTSKNNQSILEPGAIAKAAAEHTKAAAARANGKITGKANGKHSELLRAREMPDFSLGNERTDVRGWQVYSNDAVLVGSVASLFVDMHSKAVRYLGVALGDPRSKMPDGEVLVPVGSASRPDDRQVIILGGLSYAQLAAAPRLAKHPITRADENAALGVYGMATWRDVSASELYSSPNFEERRLFGARD